MFVSRVLDNTPVRKLYTGITVLSLLCITIQISTGLSFLDNCITGSKNAEIIQREPAIFEKVISINPEGITTEAEKVYPLDFIEEEVYPLLPGAGTVLDVKNKCILTELTGTYLVQNIILQILLVLTTLTINRLFMPAHKRVLPAISALAGALLLAGVMSLTGS